MRRRRSTPQPTSSGYRVVRARQGAMVVGLAARVEDEDGHLIALCGDLVYANLIHRLLNEHAATIGGEA